MNTGGGKGLRAPLPLGMNIPHMPTQQLAVPPMGTADFPCEFQPMNSMAIFAFMAIALPILVIYNRRKRK